MVRFFILVVGVAGLIATAIAAPPENADPALAPFFKSLQQPGTGMSCCDIADCRTVVVTHGEGRRWAFIGTGFPNAPNTWVEVPDSVVLCGVENPTGEPIACFFGGKVQCFVPGSGVLFP